MKIHFLTSCVIIVVLLLIVDVVSAQMQVEAHSDFSGGMVNSIANAKMQDNQLVMLDNFDVTDVGYLKRRHGLELHYTDPSSGDPLMALYTFYQSGNKKLLTLRRHGDYFSEDTADSNFLTLTFCDEATSTCTTTVIGGWYDPTRFTKIPFADEAMTVTQNLIIAALNSELMIYDGTRSFPARPYGPGQPQAWSMSGSGNVTGPVDYVVCYKDTTTDSISTPSIPSWTQYPISGKVTIKVFPPLDTTRQDVAIIYRKKIGTDTAYYEVATRNLYQGDSLTYIDNISDGSLGSAMPYSWGSYPASVFHPGPPAPGEDTSAVAQFAAASTPWTGLQDYLASGAYDSLENVRIWYRFAFIDSSGAISSLSSSRGTLFDAMLKGTDTLQGIGVTGCPLPVEPGRTKGVVVLRRIDIGKWWDGGVDVTHTQADTIWENDWFILDTVEFNDYYNGGGVFDFEDTFATSTVWTGSHRWCLDTLAKRIQPWPPQDICQRDSLIQFQPTDISYHGNRMYAVGDQKHLNRIYYSEFGRPGIWAASKYLIVPSASGDWFVGLLSLGNDRLMAFRQNSIVVIGGLSFYQYSIDEAIRGVGLSAPRSVASGANRVYFAHTTGIYEFSRFGGPDDRPISWPIANSIDSLIDSLPHSWGQIINGNYWWSADSVTYIYDQFPAPHWKTYSFGVQDAAEFDYDPEVRDYRPNKVILALDNDSLYRWGYDDTATTDAGAAFTARFKTKAFLEGPNRKRVWWLQINGTGTCDSLKLTYYDDNGRDSVGYDILYPDFSDNVVDRIAINRLFTNFAFRLEDFGAGNYTIYGYEFAWQPSDGGKK